VQLATYIVSTGCIAVKIPTAEEQEDLSHENAVLDELDRVPRCAEIVQSFLRLPTANFMAFYSGGTLEQRLRHEINNDQVISVRRKESTHLVYRWMREPVVLITCTGPGPG
jgi:hypothetical protein